MISQSQALSSISNSGGSKLTGKCVKACLESGEELHMHQNFVFLLVLLGGHPSKQVIYC